MSKMDIYLSLKVYDSNCDKSEDCVNIRGADSGVLKKEKVTIPASGSISVLTSGTAVDRSVFVRSDSDFQVDVNSLGAQDVKRVPFGTSFQDALYLARLSLTSLTITNPSSTDEIVVEYTLS